VAVAKAIRSRAARSSWPVHVVLRVHRDVQPLRKRDMYKALREAYSERAGLERRRRGSVFPDRFHQEIIKNPRQARRALSYVLNDWRKHTEDRARATRTWKVDPFSTGALFSGWKERAEASTLFRWPTYEPLVVYLPQTWLL
jgi:hypothetical protein